MKRKRSHGTPNARRIQSDLRASVNDNSVMNVREPEIIRPTCPVIQPLPIKTEGSVETRHITEQGNKNEFGRGWLGTADAGKNPKQHRQANVLIKTDVIVRPRNSGQQPRLGHERAIPPARISRVYARCLVPPKRRIRVLCQQTQDPHTRSACGLAAQRLCEPIVFNKNARMSLDGKFACSIIIARLDGYLSGILNRIRDDAIYFASKIEGVDAGREGETGNPARDARPVLVSSRSSMPHAEHLHANIKAPNSE